jgi:uncharacterized membrane protein YjjP (DUF1212 family)
MVYHLTWLMTLIVCVVALIIGIVSSFLFRHGAIRTIWAVLVSLIFVVAACASVVLDYSWMATGDQRLIAQAVALCVGLSGLVYAVRDKA